VFAEAAAAFEELTLSHKVNELTMQTPDAWPNTFRQSRFISAVDIVQADRMRRGVAQEMERLLSHVDLLLVPSLRDEMLTISITGQPSLTVRAGFVQVPKHGAIGLRIRAVRCALRVQEGACELGIAVRAGLHTGEVELAGDNIAGLAVHIGARICALAEGDQTLVSSTVKDLVSGSGLHFKDRGVQALKGVPGEWRLYAWDDRRPANTVRS